MSEAIKVDAAVQQARSLSPVWAYGADFSPWRRYLATLEWTMAMRFDVGRQPKGA